MLQKIINRFQSLRPRQLLILAAVAAALMFATIFIGLKSMAHEPIVIEPVEQPKPIEMASVVVAKTTIYPRTRIQESMLQMKEMPADIVPEGAIKNFDDVKNTQIKVTIFAGDILTIQKVFAESDDEGFTGSIPANCRAISINVNDVTGVAGFAKPGDRVDLLLVESGKYSATTNILLQNVPLLSINQDTTGSAPIGENGVPKAAISNPSIATFALPPEDILKLISATKIGEIYMSLRPSKPQSNYVEAMEYTLESVNSPRAEAVRETVPVIPSGAPVTQPTPQIPVEPPTPKIEIIAGDKIVQDSTPTTPAAKPKAAQGGPTTNQPLPIIPSLGVVDFAPPSAPQTPPANLPVINP